MVDIWEASVDLAVVVYKTGKFIEEIRLFSSK